MKKIVFAGTILALASMGIPAVAHENKAFQLVVNSKPFDGQVTFNSGKYPAPPTAEVFPDSVIQLDADVPLDIAKSLGISKKTPLTAGTTMFAAGVGPSTYCSRIIVEAPCFVDSDGDGRFDHAFKTLATLNKSDLVVVRTLTITGNVANRQIALPTSIPYHQVDIDSVQKPVGMIVSSSDFKRDAPGPVHFSFRISTLREAANEPFGSGSFFSTIKDVTFDGTPVTIDFYGIQLTVTGITEKGAPLYTLLGQIDHVKTDFVMKDAYWDGVIDSLPQAILTQIH